MKYYLKMLEVANKVAKVSLAKKLLIPIYYPIKSLFSKHKNRIFKKNALRVLAEFDHCLKQNGFVYSLAFGTLLGAVREKGFIKHDLDIDVAMWDRDYSPMLIRILSAAGFSLDHSFEAENGNYGREQTYVKDGVYIDIFFFYEDEGEYPYCCDFLSYNMCPTYRESMKKYGRVLARRIELPMMKEVVLTPFETIQLYIPQNAHQILKFRYGEDYMIPNPQWTITSYDRHITVMDNIKAVYKEGV